MDKTEQTNTEVMVSLTVQELKLIKELIELSSVKGILHPKNYIGVGIVYQKLDQFLNTTQS